MSDEKITSLTTRRFFAKRDPADHSPRAALEAALEWYDASVKAGDDPHHCIVIFGRDMDNGGSGVRFFQAGSYRAHAQMGLVLEGIDQLKASGSD